LELSDIARAVGYRKIFQAETQKKIKNCLSILKIERGPSFLEIRVNKGSRNDLGRPALTPQELKEAFMSFLN
jgi:phosphonopyruvate decarboxylase